MKLLITLILLYWHIGVRAQSWQKITSENGTFYTFIDYDILDTSLTVPPGLPDGKWIVTSKNKWLKYEFYLVNQAVHGPFVKYISDIISDEGKYRMDSIWSFRVNFYDIHDFKEGLWRHNWDLQYFENDTPCCFKYSYLKVYNEWYENGQKKYESRPLRIAYYYDNGNIQQAIISGKLGESWTFNYSKSGKLTSYKIRQDNKPRREEVIINEDSSFEKVFYRNNRKKSIFYYSDWGRIIKKEFYFKSKLIWTRKFKKNAE